MNDSEIRERVREAVGEAQYPPDLPGRVQAQLKAPRRESAHPRAIGLIAAILAIAVVAALFAPRLLTRQTSLLQPAASPAPQSSEIPAQDLAAAQLTAVASLVDPLHLVAQSGSQRIELIAAYADAARTVLFFRMTPDAGLPMASIDDAYGFLNASSSGSRGVPGDYVFALNAGPRPGIDGIAGHAVANKLCHDGSIAFLCMIEGFDNQNACAFTDDKAVSLGVKWAAGACGLLVARGKRLHGRESADTHRRDRRLGAAADHHLRIAPLDDAKGIAYGVCGCGACRSGRRIRPPSAVANRNHA